MIRKFGRVTVDPGLVRAIFADTDNWSLWMPGVETVRTLERRDDYARVAFTQRYRGRTFDEELECRFAETGTRLRQLSGFFRKWDSSWRFLRSPDGKGTTLTCELEIELGGVVGLLASDRLLDGFLDALFRDTLQRLETRAQTLAGAREPAHADVLLRVFQTPEGLEVWINGKDGVRSFLLPPAR